SQLRHYIITHIVKGADIKSATFIGRKEVGEYLKNKVFALGATLPWNEMVKQATGEPLTARYFAEQFVR
ncbi:MAG: peptidase M3, partial [Candidatus Aminicenantes bacterium]|nr:peptidase M3 [Candidatus Aminicenantes bacterium]